MGISTSFAFWYLPYQHRYSTTFSSTIPRMGRVIRLDLASAKPPSRPFFFPPPPLAALSEVLAANGFTYPSGSDLLVTAAAAGPVELSMVSAAKEGVASVVLGGSSTATDPDVAVLLPNSTDLLDVSPKVERSGADRRAHLLSTM